MRVDAWKLSRERRSVEGNIDAHRLTRVGELLAPGPAGIGWRLSGTTDADGRAALELALDGEVTLTCQRCLDVLQWPVHVRGTTLLAGSAAELAALDAHAEAEVVLAAEPVDPLELVEDELLLALPFAPRHPADACAVPAGPITTHRRA